MINYNCERCLWWDNQHKTIGELSDYGYGYCRKHKPVIYSKDDRYWGSWPLVDRNDFCGEFREGEL